MAAHAQTKKVMNLVRYDQAPYHFGFTLGINQMDFTVKPVANLNTLVFSSRQTPDLNVDSSRLLSVNSTPVFGFYIGIVGDLRLGRYFNLRFVPDLSFGERYLNYSVLGYQNGEKSILEIKKNIPSGFLDFPLLLKYKSKRLNNMLAYVTAGVQYSVDLGSGAKKKDNTQDYHVKLQKNDLYALAGVGFDFYNPWFKFGIELKMAYGLFDMLSRENTIYTDGIEKLNSKVFELCLTFE
jgi:hypothetical protein